MKAKVPVRYSRSSQHLRAPGGCGARPRFAYQFSPFLYATDSESQLEHFVLFIGK